MSEDLVNRARENASARDENEWGYRVTLEPGDSFSGRWRGETMTSGDYGEQRVYLLWDHDGQECYLYGGRARLDRKIDSLALEAGNEVAIFRGDDEVSNGRTIHSYGVASQMTLEPLPNAETQQEIDW